jgi:hypothetical protein
MTFQFNFRLKLKKKTNQRDNKKRIKEETFNYPFMSQIMKFLIKVIKYINISLSKPFNIIFHSLITFQFNFKLKLKKK